MSDQSAITIKEYFNAPAIRERFADVVGSHNAGPYMASVLLAVANNQQLQDCTPASIYTAALRAATLRLSVDPATKQAYLVPFNGKGGKQASLIVGYKGLYDMAMRTGHYKRIDVYPLNEGISVEEDIIAGTIKLAGGKKSDKITSWLAIFEFTTRFGGGMHYIWMTVDQIHDHARRYSKGYERPDGVWKQNPQAMEHKTVLRILLTKWGYLDPVDAAQLELTEAPEEDGEIIEGEMSDAPEPRSEADIMGELGY